MTETERSHSQEERKKVLSLSAKSNKANTSRLMSIPVVHTLSKQVGISPQIEKESCWLGKSSFRDFLYAVKLLMRLLSPPYFSCRVFPVRHPRVPRDQ